MPDYFAFLTSNRFHAAVGAVVVYYLKAKFQLDPILADAIIAILATHIGIRTVDRFAEKSGDTDTK